MIFPQDCTGGSTGTPAHRYVSIVWALRGARVYGLPTQVNNHMGLRWKPIAVPHSKPVAFHAVRLQEAVYRETAETGFVDRNNLHRVLQDRSARAFSRFSRTRRAVVSATRT